MSFILRYLYRRVLIDVQYALGDFAVRQAAKVLGKGDDAVALYGNRSMGFTKVWDPTVTSDGFSGFAQRRFAVCLPSLLPRCAMLIGA